VGLNQEEQIIFNPHHQSAHQTGAAIAGAIEDQNRMQFSLSKSGNGVIVCAYLHQR
jgi:hypothetical protein